MIRMSIDDDGPPAPHFRARYQDAEAAYGIEQFERVAGSLPWRQEHLVLTWAKLHQAELLSNWRLLQQGRSPTKIDPLEVRVS
jgi:hypothetical protein